ncbi:mex-6 [Pristionchus pacificus]|uniref:Mex-6 n=1 Tax=Pristionchus pacificus TaxID=54126 RepID=A0A2A6BKE8_PRIPA|nr:mex-6 [Pristionchus pacificus]|eukprot:PDM66296.1 mex-6 [Pristionchus pacificus]
MDPNMQQQPQYYYAPGAPQQQQGGAAPPAGYYAAGDSNGYVLPMQQPQQQMMYYAPAAPGYAYAAPVYYQPTEAAFAAMSLSGQTLLPMQPQQQMQPQQTPGASSTTSNGSQPRAASTPIPSEEPAGLAAPAACNPSMVPMHVMYTQVGKRRPVGNVTRLAKMPQYYHPMQQQQGGYEQQAQQLVPVMYQDPTTGQMMQTMQPMQSQHQQPPFLMNRMMSTDPDLAPENIDDISQISHQSSPETFMETPGQRNPSTPVSVRRRVSLPPQNGNAVGNPHISNLLPSNYKTRMCTQWMDKRECSMGGSCKFAHGNQELRVPERPLRAINNPKYKTKMCKNFEPGASGLCAYAERCEYIHPNDREYAAYRARIEQLARARGEFTRYKQLLDEVPAVPRGRGRGGAASMAGGDEENKSVRSSADSSRGCGEDGGSPPPPAHRARRGSANTGGYLGSAMPPIMTRSAIRMGAGADSARYASHHGGHYGQPTLRKNVGGGSMYNLASGAYSDRDDYKTRLARVPSASNVASLGLGGGGDRRGGGKYGGPAPAKFNRRASMCHLNTADY